MKRREDEGADFKPKIPGIQLPGAGVAQPNENLFGSLMDNLTEQEAEKKEPQVPTNLIGTSFNLPEKSGFLDNLDKVDYLEKAKMGPRDASKAFGHEHSVKPVGGPGAADPYAAQRASMAAAIGGSQHGGMSDAGDVISVAASSPIKKPGYTRKPVRLGPGVGAYDDMDDGQYSVGGRSQRSDSGLGRNSYMRNVGQRMMFAKGQHLQAIDENEKANLQRQLTQARLANMQSSSTQSMNLNNTQYAGGQTLTRGHRTKREAMRAYKDQSFGSASEFGSRYSEGAHGAAPGPGGRKSGDGMHQTNMYTQIDVPKVGPSLDALRYPSL